MQRQQRHQPTLSKQKKYDGNNSEQHAVVTTRWGFCCSTINGDNFLCQLACSSAAANDDDDDDGNVAADGYCECASLTAPNIALVSLRHR